MVTKERNINEMCSFYVSDFHLEMIILPYINKKIEENYKIQIITQNDLNDSIKILLNKLNLNDEKKNKIAQLNWNNSKFILPKENEKIVIVVKGSEEFINKNNKNIENENLKNELVIINCYDLEEIKPKMENLTKRYNKVLNILGENEF